MTPHAGCVLLDGHAERDRLGRRERGDDVVDRPGRDLGRIERGQPGGRRAARRSARPGSGAARRGARPGRRWSRTVDRRPAPGSPSAAHSRGHCRSDPTATAIAPSAVSKVSYGTMFGWALPSRPGATPADERVLRLVDEAGQRRAEERDVDPLAARRRPGRPSRSRPTSAARTPTAPSIPVTTSLIATPTLVGSPPSASGAPVIDISPLDGLDDEVVAGPVGRRAARARSPRSRGGRAAG